MHFQSEAQPHTEPVTTNSFKAARITSHPSHTPSQHQPRSEPVHHPATPTAHALHQPTRPAHQAAPPTTKSTAPRSTTINGQTDPSHQPTRPAHQSTSPTLDIEDETTRISANRETLRALADNIEGNVERDQARAASSSQSRREGRRKAYEAADSGEFRDVYANIGTSLGFKTEHRDVAARYTGIALLFALAAGGASLA
ncbi:MAG: hypothetical protein ACRDNL_22090, partial [Spirillospora sp.]